jgi:putative oxidoreductase
MMRQLLGRKYPNLALLMLRLVAGGIFAYEGALKLFVWDRVSLAGYFGGLGFPMPEIVGMAIGVFEFVGGLLIVAGIFTRLLSLFAAIEMAVAAVVANLPSGITAATEVGFLLFAIFLALFLVGAGKFSLIRLVGISTIPRFSRRGPFRY